MLTSASGDAVTFQHTLVIAGRIAGTWRLTRGPRELSIRVVPLRRLTRDERRELTQTAQQYERFTSLPVKLSIG